MAIKFNSVLVLKMSQGLIAPGVQILQAVRLATHTSSGGEEAHWKGGGGERMFSPYKR
jgi:hypothetical protein